MILYPIPGEECEDPKKCKEASELAKGRVLVLSLTAAGACGKVRGRKAAQGYIV